MALEWSDERFGTGLQVLDEQHRVLVHRFSELCIAVEKGAPTRQVDEMILFLWDHVSLHFAREERLLRAAAVPEQEAHIEQHRRFARELEYFRRAWSGARGDLHRAGVLVQWLEAWLTHHVGRTDLALRVRRGSGAPPRIALVDQAAA